MGGRVDRQNVVDVLLGPMLGGTKGVGKEVWPIASVHFRR